jgi:hypothetical protein
MSRKLAVKRLTASDLTFFEWQFRNRNAGNQKAINLNRNIFIDILYPQLPDIAFATGGKVALDLFIFGPGLAGEHNLQRKIVKWGTYKNWRLNGEFIYNPDDNPQRYNALAPGDIAVFDFIGEITPTSTRMVLIGGGTQEDTALHQVFGQFLGQRSMAALSSTELDQLVGQANPPGNHPIQDLLLGSSLEEVANGVEVAAQRLIATGRRVSRETFQQAKQNAEATGQLGEEFVNIYLSGLRDSGEILDFEWVSQTNVVSPYDFRIDYDGGRKVFIDVKSTSGEFERAIHISFSELRQMGLSHEEYYIYRVYDIGGEETANLRISEDLTGFARRILDVFGNLPENVMADGISLTPSILGFGSMIDLTIGEPEE